MERDYTIAIDLGGKSVKAAAGYRTQSGKIRVEAVSVLPSEGVRAGRIENINDATRTLSKVIYDLEVSLGVKIAYAYGSLSSESLRSEHHTETINVIDPNMGITRTDINTLRDMMMRVSPADGEVILDLMPQNYVIDNRHETASPFGSFGRTLSSTYNFVVCEAEAQARLRRAFACSDISMKWCLSNAVNAAHAVLTEEEMKGGVALVDLGDGVTNVSIFYGGTLRYIGSIPLGGAAINNDIRSLRIPEKQVEELKVTYGCARAANVSGSIEVAGRTPRDTRELPLYNLAVAIEERMKDIIAYVRREISDSHYKDKLSYGIVLTGGGAKLDEVDDLFMDILDMDVRIATPDVDLDDDSIELVADPELTAVIGLLRRGIESDAANDSKPCTTAIVVEEDVKEEALSEEQINNARTLRDEDQIIKDALKNSKKQQQKEEVDINDLGELYDEKDEEGESVWKKGIMGNIVKTFSGAFSSNPDSSSSDKYE